MSRLESGFQGEQETVTPSPLPASVVWIVSDYTDTYVYVWFFSFNPRMFVKSWQVIEMIKAVFYTINS